MNSIGRIDHTRAAVVAVQWIKQHTNKEIHTFKDIIPQASKELLDKKTYMQSDEFLKDTHNAEMFDLTNKLGQGKDSEILERIASLCKNVKDSIGLKNR